MLMRLFEIIFSLSLFANAALFIPQAVRIYKCKSGKGVSLITFVGFLFIQASIVANGIIRDDRVLAFGTSLSLLTCGAVVWLLVYYRMK